MTKHVEVLLQSGPMLLFRLVEKSGFRSLAAVGGDRIPLFPEKEPVAVAAPKMDLCRTRPLTMVAEGGTR